MSNTPPQETTTRSGLADANDGATAPLTAGLPTSGPLSALPQSGAPGVQAVTKAGQISEHLVYHLRRRAPSGAAQASAPAPVKPPDHIYSSTTLLSAWLADTHATWSEDDLRGLVLQPEAPPPASSGTAFAIFSLGGHRWGVPLACLREVLPTLPPLTPLPFSPLWLSGLINVRSEPVGVINLSELLLDPITATNTQSRSNARPVLIAESNGTPLGLLVEEVGKTVFPEESQLQHLSAAETRWLPPLALAHLHATWTDPHTKELFLLLDLPRLLAVLLQQASSGEAARG
jgi:chemotaxis signal transduction protein